MSLPVTPALAGLVDIPCAVSRGGDFLGDAQVMLSYFVTFLLLATCGWRCLACWEVGEVRVLLILA